MPCASRSGDVAKTLAAGFLQKGHVVMIGSRSPQKLADWVAGQAGMKAGTFAETAAFGEVVVLCVLGRAAEEALALAGADNLAGKVVVLNLSGRGDKDMEQAQRLLDLPR